MAPFVWRPLSLQVFGRSSKNPAENAVRLPNGPPGKPDGLPDWPDLNGLQQERSPTICPSSLMPLLYAAIGLGEGWQGFEKPDSEFERRMRLFGVEHKHGTPSIAAGDVTPLKAKITITGIHANLNNTIMPSGDMAKHDRKPIGGR
jgi:hypothetical protein